MSINTNKTLMQMSCSKKTIICHLFELSANSQAFFKLRPGAQDIKQ